MTPNSPQIHDELTLCPTGDVMTGHGVDQILPHPNDPVIYESDLRDARGWPRTKTDRFPGPSI